MSERETPNSELRCARCGYNLEGLDQRIIRRCPECGELVDWRALRFPGDPWPRRVRGTVWVLAPHVAAALCMAGGSIAERWWGPREMNGGAAILLILVYVFTSPFCAIGGVYGAMGRPDGAWKRIEAAVYGVGICALLMACTGCGLGGALWGFNV